MVTANPTAQAQEQYGVLLQAPNHGLTDGFPVEIYSNGQFLGFRQFREAIPRMSFAKEILRWGSGLVRRRGDLPGFEYSQIQEYLETVKPMLDAKYEALGAE